MYLKQAAICLVRSFSQNPNPIFSKLFLNVLSPNKSELSCHYVFGSHNARKLHKDLFIWMFLAGPTVVFAANSSPALAEGVSVEKKSENNVQGANFTDLRKIEDGSVISNIHTSKWRVFTDSGRDYFVQGKLEDAERLFIAALQEAKKGFGEKDPHVASAFNNLAELYRVKKAFDKAEPFYMEAVKILEESFGVEDVRVAAALHNLGQFYLVQRKLEDARLCYEKLVIYVHRGLVSPVFLIALPGEKKTSSCLDRAMKIKRRVLGHAHLDYADTMFHLGMVLHLQGKERDAETLIEDSVRILEEGGQGESMLCIKRLRYLVQIFIKSNRFAEAEIIQRRILHALELSKGWKSLDTIIAAEGLGLTLQSVGELKEAKDILERCLKARKTILSEDHIQVSLNLLHLARVEMLNSDHMKKTNLSEAIAELAKAKDHLSHSVRIAQQILYKSAKQGDKKLKDGVRLPRKDEHATLLILLQSLIALGQLENNRQELLDLKGEHSPTLGAENAFRQCISSFKKFGGFVSNSPDIKAEYLSCLKHLYNLISDKSTEKSQRADQQELKDEIKIVESELMQKAKHGI